MTPSESREWPVPPEGCSGDLGCGHAPAPTHWLTLFDPEDGEPYGVVCDCPIGEDHDGTGELNG